MFRMQKERITVSLDGRIAARVRQCAARSRGGASGYLERLIREDEMREAVAAAGRWYAAHPGSVIWGGRSPCCSTARSANADFRAGGSAQPLCRAAGEEPVESG